MPDRVISVPQAAQIATRIKNKFDNVNGRLQQQEAVIDFQRKEPDATDENWAVTNEGYAVVNQNYSVYKYLVTPGEEIFCIAPTPAGAKASYAFTDGLNISQSNLDHIIGTPATTAVNGRVTVPEGAVYIFFSCLKTDTTSGVYVSSTLDNMGIKIESTDKKITDYTDNITLIVNKLKSDDNKSYGDTRFSFPVFRGQRITVTNGQDTAWTCSIRDENGVTLQSFQIKKGETKTNTVSVDGSYFNVYQNVYPLVGTVVAESVGNYVYRMSTEVSGLIGETSDIVDMNRAVPGLVQSAHKILYGQTVTPLSLLHFSDPHGSKTNVTRMIQMANALGTSIDDIICTGDMVNNKYADGYAWWDEIAGAENILTCIGNHDVSDGTAYNQYGITAEEAYNTYFAPYIDNWNVEHTGTNTYYYKDYPTKNIRLIVLDYLLTRDAATAQNAWLQSALAGAKTAGYTVVIAQHCQPSNFANIPSNFTMVYKHTSCQYPVIYQQSVQSFIDGGGEFACFIAGHTHWDMLCINPDYPNQICICVTCAITTGRDNDQIRAGGTKSQDAGNVVTVDTENKLIKLIRVGADIDNYLRPRNTLTISYVNKTIFAEG